MDHEVSELDWHSELKLALGPLVSLRVWPAKTAAFQAQWAAVDIWVAMKTTSVVQLTAQERQKARTLDLS